MSRFSLRYPSIALLLILASLGFAYYAEYIQNVIPCPLCLLQRYMFILVAVLLALACLHNPQKLGRKIWSACITLFSLVGAALAIRQVYLQVGPTSAATTCLPGMRYLLQTMHWTEVLKIIVIGSAECGTVHWKFLGLSMADWSLVIFVITCILMLMWFFQRQRD